MDIYVSPKLFEKSPQYRLAFESIGIQSDEDLELGNIVIDAENGRFLITISETGGYIIEELE